MENSMKAFEKDNCPDCGNPVQVPSQLRGVGGLIYFIRRCPQCRVNWNAGTQMCGDTYFREHQNDSLEP